MNDVNLSPQELKKQHIKPINLQSDMGFPLIIFGDTGRVRLAGGDKQPSGMINHHS